MGPFERAGGPRAWDEQKSWEQRCAEGDVKPDRFDDDIEIARVEWLRLLRQIEVPVLWLLVVVLLLAMTGCKDWLPSNPIPGGLL